MRRLRDCWRLSGVHPSSDVCCFWSDVASKIGSKEWQTLTAFADATTLWAEALEQLKANLRSANETGKRNLHEPAVPSRFFAPTNSKMYVSLMLDALGISTPTVAATW